MMLPGDARSAWKSPLLYRNQVLSLCTMKVAPRQPSETFTGFTRHLAIKAKSAGVLSIDSFTTMFLVPSSKLAVHLGFCAAEEPPRMFCIVCRRHTIPLSPIATTVWPLASPVVPPAGSRSAPSSHTGTPVGTFATAIRPASLDLKAQHKAKIVVSSPEKNLRLSPKHTHPRQIAKRSLSFPYSLAKDASKCLQRISRSASTSGSVGFRADSTAMPAMPAMPSEVSNGNSMHRSDAGRLSDDSQAVKGDSHDSRTSPEEHCLNSASSREKSQDGQSCNEADTKRAKTTPDLKGYSSESSANTLTSLPSELVAVYISHLATLKKCSNVSKKPQGGDSESELKPPKAKEPHEVQTSCNAHQGNSCTRESQAYSNTDAKKFHAPLYRTSPAHSDVGRSRVTVTSVTPSTVEDSCTTEKPARSRTDGRNCDETLPSASLAHGSLDQSRVTMEESAVTPSAACTSPSSMSFSPFWPDSPLLFFPGSERIPFLSDTPVKKDGRNPHEKGVSVNPGEKCLPEYLEQSQQRDEFSADRTRHLMTRDEAVSTSRVLVESPFEAMEEKSPNGVDLHLENWNTNSSNLNDKQVRESLEIPFEALEEKSPHGVNIHLENWNTNSSYLNDKRALRNLRKAVARAEIPKLHKNKNTELQDDLQTIDMDISESPLCPIILSHTYSCTPSMPPYDSSSKNSNYSLNLTGSSAPYSGGEHARNAVDSSSHSNTTETLETLSSVFGDPGDAWKYVAVSVDVQTTAHTELSSRDSSEYFVARDGTSFACDTRDARAFPMDNTKTRVDVDPRVLESGDIVEPIDMDIADDSELLSNTVVCESDTRRSAPPTESAEVLESCNTKSVEAPLSSTEKPINGSSQGADSLSEVTNTSKQNVAISEETLPPEVTTSKITTDCCSETTLPSRKRPYSCLASSLEQDTDSSVAKDSQQNPVLSTTSDAPIQTTCSPNKDTPSTFSLTNRKALGFSFSPKKCSQVCSRQLKTLQDAFTVATNCDQPNLCKPVDGKSAELSSVKPCKSAPRKSTASHFKTVTNDICKGALKSTNGIDRKNSDDTATTDERKDCTPLAVSCTAFEKEVKDLPGHTGANLGGVIETSLYQDWGLQRGATDCTELQLTEESSYLTIEELDVGATEVTDLGSEADRALEPIEFWPMIDDCDFPEPETVMCSPVNSIETFTFRFPGKFGFDEDVTEIFPTETRTTEEENTLVEERFRGVCMVPEVVICSDVDSETIVPCSEDHVPEACPPEKHSEGVGPREELKTFGSMCVDSQRVGEIVHDARVSQVSGEELHWSELSEDLNVLEGESSVERSKLTVNCAEGSLAKLSASLTSRSVERSKEVAIQSKDSEVSDRGSYESVVPLIEICCTEKPNSSLRDSMETAENVALPTTMPPLLMDLREETSKTGYSTETRRKETHPGNACSTQLQGKGTHPGNSTGKVDTTNSFDRLPCSILVQGKDRHTRNVPERVEAVNCPGKVSYSTQVQGKESRPGNVETGNCTEKSPRLAQLQGEDRHTRNVPERVETVNCPGKLSYSTQVQGKESRPGNVETDKSPYSAQLQGKDRHTRNATERVERVNCSGKLSHSSQVQGKEKHPENEAEKMVNCCGKLLCSTEVNMKERHPGNATEREEIINLPCSSERPTDVQEKKCLVNSTERVQAINCPNDVAEARSDSRQEPVIPDSVKPKTLQSCHTDHNLQVKPSRENKPFTATLSEAVKPTKLDSSPQTRNTNKRQCSGVNNTTDFTAKQDVSVKSVEPSANTVKHCKSVDKTTKTVQSLNVTTSQPPRPSNKCEIVAQEGKTKDGRGRDGSRDGSRGRDARGKSEPLGDMNDLQRDNRMLNGKRKQLTEPENVAKQQKLSPVPPLMFTDGSVERDRVERDRVERDRVERDRVERDRVERDRVERDRVERDHVAREHLREMNFGDNRFCGYYTERDQCDYLRQAVYDREEEARLKTIYEKHSFPCWTAPTLPTHSHIHNGEREVLPHLVPNDPRWYPQRDITNYDRFEPVQPRLSDYGRPMFVSNMCRARPMFSPAPTVPDPWSLPGNSCHVSYPLLRPR
ncbi:hypothetical protein OS493_031924 [Desmophyllum pertusum]|uniref:Uncharacterized protein n=1 Tax=Desmophyllum pertusum TaxID=174260 RepID=A0A9X0A0G8_9CNID|nr:hypothetical protein OS493_031924 [Desmophyllum pertusum]